VFKFFAVVTMITSKASFDAKFPKGKQVTKNSKYSIAKGYFLRYNQGNNRPLFGVVVYANKGKRYI
jgi:hypothetical protein